MYYSVYDCYRLPCINFYYRTLMVTFISAKYKWIALICLAKLSLRVNILSHSLQENFGWQWTDLICWLNFKYEIDLPHILHGLVFFSFDIVKFYDKINVLRQYHNLKYQNWKLFDLVLNVFRKQSHFNLNHSLHIFFISRATLLCYDDTVPESEFCNIASNYCLYKAEGYVITHLTESMFSVQTRFVLY